MKVSFEKLIQQTGDVKAKNSILRKKLWIKDLNKIIRKKNEE